MEICCFWKPKFWCSKNDVIQKQYFPIFFAADKISASIVYCVHLWLSFLYYVDAYMWSCHGQNCIRLGIDASIMNILVIFEWMCQKWVSFYHTVPRWYSIFYEMPDECCIEVPSFCRVLHGANASLPDQALPLSAILVFSIIVLPKY